MFPFDGKKSINAGLCPKCQSQPWKASAKHLGRWELCCHRRSTVRLQVIPRDPSSHVPVTSLSMISQWKYRHTDIYITCSSLVPVPCPKMFRVFNFIWTTTKSHCIPQGVMVPRNSKGSGHCQQERKFKLLVNFGITVDGFQPWQTFKLLWQSICHWKTSKNLFREERWSFTQDTGVGIKRRRFFPLLCHKVPVNLCQPFFNSYNSPSIT